MGRRERGVSVPVAASTSRESSARGNKRKSIKWPTCMRTNTCSISTLRTTGSSPSSRSVSVVASARVAEAMGARAIVRSVDSGGRGRWAERRGPFVVNITTPPESSPSRIPNSAATALKVIEYTCVVREFHRISRVRRHKGLKVQSCRVMRTDKPRVLPFPADRLLTPPSRPRGGRGEAPDCVPPLNCCLLPRSWSCFDELSR